MKERTGAREGDTRGVSPSRAPVFSCAHYFQAPATQASDQIKMRDYMDRRVTPPTWGLLPPRKKVVKGSMNVVFSLPTESSCRIDGQF